MKKYESIAQNIAEKIENDVYVERLPSERALSKTYNASINTIKNSLNLLKEENLIYSKHGSGHFIRHAKTYNLLNFKNNNNLDDSNSRILAKTLSFNILRSNENQAQKLEITTGSLIYDIVRLRIIADKPKYIEHMIISYDLLPDITEETLNDSIIVYAQQQLNSDIDFTANTVKAVALSEEEANLLNSVSNHPALSLNTHYFLKSGVKFAYYSTLHVDESFDFIQKP